MNLLLSTTKSQFIFSLVYGLVYELILRQFNLRKKFFIMNKFAPTPNKKGMGVTINCHRLQMHVLHEEHKQGNRQFLCSDYPNPFLNNLNLRFE